MEMTILQTGLIRFADFFFSCIFCDTRFIPMLKRLKFGQAIREEAPKAIWRNQAPQPWADWLFY